jgi:hypothetical protein
MKISFLLVSFIGITLLSEENQTGASTVIIWIGEIQDATAR